MAKIDPNAPVTYAGLQQVMKNGQFNIGNRNSQKGQTEFRGFDQSVMDKAFAKQLNAEITAIEASYKKREKIANQYLVSIENQYKKHNITLEEYEREKWNTEAKLQAIALEKADKEAIARAESRARQEIAIERAKQNEYILANANGKQQIIKQEIAAKEEVIKIYKERKAAGEKLSKEELQDLGEQEQALNALRDQDSRLTKAKLEARTKNVPAEQKLADLEERYNNRLRADKKARTTRDEAIAAAKELFGEDTDDYKMAVGKANKTYQKQTQLDNDEFGIDINNMSSMLSGALGGVLGNAGGPLGDIIEGVTAISDVVQLALSGNPIGIAVKLLTSIVSLINKGLKKMQDSIELYANTESQYLGKINSRLDGTGKTYNTLLDYFTTAIGSNPYISQKGLVETMGNLVDAGVAYNLEQRTILTALSDRMVATFDMLDAHLTRLTRLQQADMSIAALGAESILTQFLNTNFQDSSYMSDMYDSVASTIIEAASQMTQKDSVAFTYNVQKWLGSLYSLGMSEAGISTLAQGITYLATGQVDQFNSNEALRNLFAMASGGSYADLLVNGVNASNIDDLLSNIVTYLAQISTDTNQVTKQVKAGIFGGLSLSDIRSVANLTVDDYNAIIASQATWESSLSQTTDYLLDFAQQNTSIASRINTILENTWWNIGENFVNDKTLFGHTNKYIIYEIGQSLGGLLGNFISGLSELGGVWGGIKTAAKSLNKTFTPIGSLQGETGSTILQQMLSDSYLIKERGMAYAGTVGVMRGISASATMGIEGGMGDTAISNPYATQETQTTSNARDIAEYDTATYTRDMNDIYRALFEEQLPMRVILVSAEDQAKQDFAIINGAQRTYSAGGIIDGVNTVASLGSSIINALENGMSDWTPQWDVDPSSVAL